MELFISCRTITISVIVENQPASAGFFMPGENMITKSMLLNTATWDLQLDDFGNIAQTENPYAVAQDVATACSTFAGECWYDTTLGLPYYEKILGHWPGTQYVNTKLQTEAKKLPYVQSATCSIIIGQSDRKASGVMVITDTNNVESTIQL